MPEKSRAIYSEGFACQLRTSSENVEQGRRLIWETPAISTTAPTWLALSAAASIL